MSPNYLRIFTLLALASAAVAFNEDIFDQMDEFWHNVDEQFEKLGQKLDETFSSDVWLKPRSRASEQGSVYQVIMQMQGVTDSEVKVRTYGNVIVVNAVHNEPDQQRQYHHTQRIPNDYNPHGKWRFSGGTLTILFKRKSSGGGTSRPAQQPTVVSGSNSAYPAYDNNGQQPSPGYYNTVAQNRAPTPQAPPVNTGSVPNGYGRTQANWQSTGQDATSQSRLGAPSGRGNAERFGPSGVGGASPTYRETGSGDRATPQGGASYQPDAAGNNEPYHTSVHQHQSGSGYVNGDPNTYRQWESSRSNSRAQYDIDNEGRVISQAGQEVSLPDAIHVHESRQQFETVANTRTVHDSPDRVPLDEGGFRSTNERLRDNAAQGSGSTGHTLRSGREY